MLINKYMEYMAIVQYHVWYVFYAREKGKGREIQK